jgi:betaine-aldehyde dehydrogenase
MVDRVEGEPVTGRMLIDGQLVESSSGQWMESVNPATEEIVGRVPHGTAGDLERAVDAAQVAQRSWAELSTAQRSDYVNRFADALEARADDVLGLEVADTGNSITGMKGDIAGCIDRLRYFAGLGYELQGNTVPGSANALNLTVREPYGVVGRIVAFNHPFAMSVQGLASPLMAGNTVILKPSEQCPLSASLLGEIAKDVFPRGVVNVIFGDGTVGDALVRHPKVKRLSFVGSIKTGLAIQRSAAEVAVKAISLELGGKNPFIVFPDVDVEEAANAAVAAMNFIWQGQSCTSTSRLFVHDAIYEEVLGHVVDKVKDIQIGDPYKWETQMGALTSRAHLERVEDFVRSGEAEGARLVAGGKRPAGPAFAKGFWFQPTVFADVRQDMRIAREEIFGPVLSVIRWSDRDQVIEMANSVEYGLTGAVWTRDITAALQTARRLQSGYIWINGANTQARGVPFGGYKNSGVGRERGLEELYSYTEEKSLQIVF